MANQYIGAGMQWAIGGTTCTAFGGFKLQSRDHSSAWEMEEVKGDSGDVEAVTWFNESEEATFTYIPTGSAGSGNVTPTIPAVGTNVTVGNTNGYNQITGSTWYVTNWNTQGSNTAALRVTVNLKKYPNMDV